MRSPGSWADARSVGLCAGMLALSVFFALPAAADAARSAGGGSVHGMPPVNAWGVPGMVDMPMATPMPDGRISAAFAAIGPLSRTSFGFQAGPRIAAGFRYSRAEGLLTGDSDWADSAFDLRLTLLDHAEGRPAVTLGFHDILGTGLSSGEYLVATQRFAPGLSASAGIGWGRFGQAGGLGRGTRPPLSDRGEGGPEAWFTGPAAPFAGISWAATDRLTFALEYSADRYEAEVAAGLLDRPAPWNAGVTYEVSEGVRLGAYTLGGQEIGFSLSLAVDPKGTPALGPRIGAPPPVIPRGPGTHVPGTAASLAAPLSRALASEGLRMEAFDLDGTRAELRLSNARHEAWPQALGRAARTLTRGLPPEVETLTLVAVENGLAETSLTVARSDLERLETAPGAAEELRRRAVLAPASMGRGTIPPGTYPRFAWSLTPYLRARVFQGTDAGRGEAGLRLNADWQPAPGLSFGGTATTRIAGTLDGGTPPASTLPRVRTDAALYDATNPSLDRLTGEWRGRLASSVYARTQAGLLEPMFAGIAGEALWKPDGSRLALGVELAQVFQRTPGTAFDLGDYETMTGHLSAYWDFGGGVTGRIDAGRYLAGDWGATAALDRTFANGWRVGIYATATDAEDVPGGFDRGIAVTIPSAWFRGNATRATTELGFGGQLTDAGQRLNLSGRLYDSVRAADRTRIERDWARFWR